MRASTTRIRPEKRVDRTRIRKPRADPKAHSCDCHHIARRSAAVSSQLSIVNITFDPSWRLSPALAGLFLRRDFGLFLLPPALDRLRDLLMLSRHLREAARP
jgi:hypothetical protein